MTEDRPTVVVGLSGARRDWTTRLSRWSTSAVAPVEFLRCLSADEVRAVLGAGRPVALLLLDTSAADRDLVDLAQRLGTPTALVHGAGPEPDWVDLGCVAVLDGALGPDDVVAVLERVEVSERSPAPPARAVDLEGPPRPGLLVAVAGSGGAGVSTTAMLLAHALAVGGPLRPAHGSATVLVDSTGDDGLALYHDVESTSPGLTGLVELHRRDRVDPDEVRSTTCTVPTRPYRLLLGDPPGGTDRTTPTTARAVLDGLVRAFASVVVDVGSTFATATGTTGDARIVHRAVASASLLQADVAVVVGRGGLHGTHRVLQSLRLVRAQRGEAATLVACAATPRSSAERRSMAATLGPEPVPITEIPVIRHLERIHRDVSQLPGRVAEDLLGRVESALERTGTDGTRTGMRREWRR